MFLQATALISPEKLRTELAGFAIGAISVAVAITALAVFALRRKRADRTLLWFGIFGVLYGIRLLTSTDLFLASAGISQFQGSSITALITFCIQLPGTLYALTLINALHTRFARVILAVATLLAVVGTGAFVAGAGVDRIYTFNNALVLFFFLPAYVWLYWRSEESEQFLWMKIGFFVFLGTVVLDNLNGLGVHRFPSRLEPYGFLVLLTAMGSVAAKRTLAGQERLQAVERELEIARRIQRSILPDKVPHIPGLEVAVCYEPMTAVAGDFYDFIELADGRLGVLIADVSGHGVPAALIASMLKMAFVSHAAEGGDPARMLSKLNAALCGRFHSHFVTATYAVLDASAGQMTFSGAAHPALLLRRANSVTEYLEENGLMLGAFESAKYSNAEVNLQQGDQILLYTDGFAEGASSSGEEFGAHRIVSTFDADQPGATLEQLWRHFTEFTRGTAQSDDLTAVAIAMVSRVRADCSGSSPS